MLRLRSLLRRLAQRVRSDVRYDLLTELIAATEQQAWLRAEGERTCIGCRRKRRNCACVDRPCVACGRDSARSVNGGLCLSCELDESASAA